MPVLKVSELLNIEGREGVVNFDSIFKLYMCDKHI